MSDGVGMALGIGLIAVGLAVAIAIIFLIKRAIWSFFNPTRRCAYCGKQMHWSPVHQCFVCEHCGFSPHDGRRY